MELHAKSNRSRTTGNGEELHFVTLSFRAPLSDRTSERKPVNVSLVLDRSGSMAGEKIETARTAVETSLRMLCEPDTFSVVVFDDHVDLIAEPAVASEEARRVALEALRSVGTGGMTNLEGGWMQGASAVGGRLLSDSSNRVMVVTDGQANRGATEPAELYRRAAQLRKQGVTTSTLGIGRDFNEELLQGLADQGGGHFYYVETPQQLVDMLSGELGESLEVVVRQPVVEVMVPAGANVLLLDNYPVEARPGGMDVRLNDLTSGELVELTFEVMLPPAAVGSTLTLGFALRSAETEEAAATTDVRWEYVGQVEFDDAERDFDVEARGARVLAASARTEALQMNRQGRYEDAGRRILEIERKLRDLAESNPLLREVMWWLEREALEMAARMRVIDMKRRHFEDYSLLKGRTPGGRARRDQ